MVPGQRTQDTFFGSHNQNYLRTAESSATKRDSNLMRDLSHFLLCLIIFNRKNNMTSIRLCYFTPMQVLVLFTPPMGAPVLRNQNDSMVSEFTQQFTVHKVPEVIMSAASIRKSRNQVDTIFTSVRNKIFKHTYLWIGTRFALQIELSLSRVNSGFLHNNLLVKIVKIHPCRKYNKN